MLKYELEKNRNIKNGDKVGIVKVYLGDKNIHNEDIFVKEIKLKKKSMLEKIKDWFDNI